MQQQAIKPTITMKSAPVADSKKLVSEHIRTALLKLEAWMEAERFRGWDPHDALISPLLRPLGRSTRLAGIAALQLFKRSPVNLRPLFGVVKDFNPKGMGLLLASYARRYQVSGEERYREKVEFFADWLLAHVSPGYHGACWGYNFDWPNRAFFAPAGTPTVVNTAFIGLAFVDVYRLNRLANRSSLETARSACDFILHDLNRTEARDELCFSYTPVDRRFVHNASMLAAWLLATVYAETGVEDLKRAALFAARYTARRQRSDGSWAYGGAANDGWVDNFHTGFVLSAFHAITRALDTSEFNDVIRHGYSFWTTRMFLPDGTARYYADRTYPIDIHSVAQAILTMLDYSGESGAAEQAIEVAEWGIRNMQDASGFFHYQIHRWYRIRIPYMRWAQAWMHRALSELEHRITTNETYC